MSTEKHFLSAIKDKNYEKALTILGELEQTVEFKRCPFKLIFDQYREIPSPDIVDFSEYLCRENVYFNNQTFIDNLDFINVFNVAFKTHLPKIVVKDVGADVLERIKPLQGAKIYKQKQELYKLADLMILAGYGQSLYEFITNNYVLSEVPDKLFSNSKTYNVFNNFFFLDRKLSKDEIDCVSSIIHFSFPKEETILFLSEQYIQSCIKIVEQKILETDDDSYRNRYELILDTSFLDDDELSKIIVRVENSF